MKRFTLILSVMLIWGCSQANDQVDAKEAVKAEAQAVVEEAVEATVDAVESTVDAVETTVDEVDRVA